MAMYLCMRPIKRIDTCTAFFFPLGDGVAWRWEHEKPRDTGNTCDHSEEIRFPISAYQENQTSRSRLQRLTQQAIHLLRRPAAGFLRTRQKSQPLFGGSLVNSHELLNNQTMPIHIHDRKQKKSAIFPRRLPRRIRLIQQGSTTPIVAVYQQLHLIPATVMSSR